MPTLDRLPRAWLHGDYRPENVIFRHGAVQAVLDFDVVRRGCRLEDIACASVTFSRSSDGTSSAFDASSMARFHQALELTDDEIRVLPELMAAVQARTAAQYRVRQREGSDPLLALRAHIQRMQVLRP